MAFGSGGVPFGSFYYFYCYFYTGRHGGGVYRHGQCREAVAFEPGGVLFDISL